MIDVDVGWQTRRLVAEPLTAAHAAAMQPVLADPSMHEFTGGAPLTSEQLLARYERLGQRRSPSGDEIWGNWVLRTTTTQALVGTVQVSLPANGPAADVARVAWEVGVPFQGQGYASEAAIELVHRLLTQGWCVVATIHPDHVASQRVAERAGLVPTHAIEDGEVVWWADPWGGRELAVGEWRPWLPQQVAERLSDVRAPWAVAAGWAIDLFAGGQPREHEDLEIAVPIGRFEEVRSTLSEFDFEVVGAGHAWSLDSAAFDVMVQTWMSERGTGVHLLDVFREPHDGDTWICRRDRSIRRPYTELIETTDDGIPYVAPEVVLLFKAKHTREKDEADFLRVLPLLDARRCAWLQTSLASVHPGHAWLSALAERD
jgi:RimJ/RimL family protein N-acetyltransferase